MKFNKPQGDLVCSVNSFGITVLPNYVFGPQFDDEVLELRKKVIIL